MIRVVLPAHLKALARVNGELEVEVNGRATIAGILDVIESCYPMLLGTIRDQVTHQRRPYVRFFACENDLSHDDPSDPLPQAVTTGSEPLLIVGAMAGG